MVHLEEPYNACQPLESLHSGATKLRSGFVLQILRGLSGTTTHFPVSEWLGQNADFRQLNDFGPAPIFIVFLSAANWG